MTIIISQRHCLRISIAYMVVVNSVTTGPLRETIQLQLVLWGQP